MSKRSILGSTLFFCALSITGASALASPIIYSVTDTGSGTLGSTPFTNQTVTVNFVADTTNDTGSAGFYSNTVGTGYVKIGTAAPVQFTDSGNVEFFVNQAYIGTGAAGIADSGSILDTESNVFESYTGSTTLPATSGPVFYNSGLGFPTTAGTFILTSAGATSTFSAGVPEPTSLALLGIGALGLLGTRRRKPSATRPIYHINANA